MPIILSSQPTAAPEGSGELSRAPPYAMGDGSEPQLTEIRFLASYYMYAIHCGEQPARGKGGFGSIAWMAFIKHESSAIRVSARDLESFRVYV